MNKNMLVEIVASTSKGSPEGESGTGYPIAQNLILTARHLLYDDDDVLYPHIEIRWHYLHQEKNDIYDWKCAKIEPTDLDEKLDVALLRCEFPEGIEHHCLMQEFNPNEEFEWESEGFSEAGHQDDVSRKATVLAGEAYSAADHADCLVLTERAYAENKELWSGISGAPVFIKGSNTIAGVIVEAPPHFKAARLCATPTWKLLDSRNKMFRDIIGYDVALKRKAQAQLKIIEFIQVKESRRKVFADLLSKTFQTPLKQAEAKSLAASILSFNVVEFLSLFDGVISLFLDPDHHQSDNTDAFEARNLAYALLPMVFDQRITDAFDSMGAYGICTMPIATTTTAEIIMAGVDQRPLSYVFMGDMSEGELLGEHNISNHIQAPNLGIADAETYVENISQHLANKYCGIKDQTRRDEIGLNRLIKRARGELKARTKAEEVTRYCFYNLPNEPLVRDEYLEVLKGLKENFPALMLMAASGSEDDEDIEFRAFFTLRKIHTTKIEV